LKGEFYSVGPESDYGIATIRDPARHRMVRKGLSHAFSAKALRTQTDVVLKYVDLWIDQVKKHGARPEGINVDEVCEESS
jgi:cytochrome P450